MKHCVLQRKANRRRTGSFQDISRENWQLSLTVVKTGDNGKCLVLTSADILSLLKKRALS